MVLQGFPSGWSTKALCLSALVDHSGEETPMAHVEAVYLIDLKELLFPGANEKVIKVPDQIAETVSPDVLDVRYVRNWAIRNNHIPANAEVGIVC